MIDRIEQLKDTRLPALETRLMAHVSARIEKMRLRITSSSFTPALATMSANAEGHLAFAGARAKAWTEGDAVKREVDRQMGCLDTDASALLARVTAAGLRNAKLTTRTRQLDPLKLANAIINPIKNAATSALTSAANAAKSDFAKVVQASQSDFYRERKVIAEAPQYDARTYGRKYVSLSHINQGCDNCEIKRFTYNKVRDDTVLNIRFSGGARIIGHGHACRWWFRVDGRDCRNDQGSSRGHIDTRFHGSYWTDLHRVMNLEGICFRHTGGVIRKGNRRISMHVQCNSDGYTGWSSNSRFSVEEIRKP